MNLGEHFRITGALKNLLFNSVQRVTGQEYIPTVAGNATIYYQKGAAAREELSS